MNSAPDAAEGSVAGERNEPAVNRAISMQSQANRVLALGLAGVFGLGALIWYYSNAVKRQELARSTAKADVTNRVQGEMNLPSIGRIDPPPLMQGLDLTGSDKPLESAQLGYHRELPEVPGAYGAANRPPPYANAAEKTPEQLALERRLSGAAFTRAAQGLSDLPRNASFSPGEGAALQSFDRGTPQDSALAALLKPAIAKTAQAQILPTQRFLLPKGAFIDCTLETAIDSTLPGMTSCIAATDTFGADGKVVLLERGTKLFGETRGRVQQGSSRVFVLWTEARTPTGVVVPLDSPGADELGRSGLSGKTNRHFWDRFGAAILISVIDGVIQSATRSGDSDGAIIYNPTSSRDLMAEVLKDTVNIPPTVVKPQGDRIQILVARDLDFRPVYELRSAITAR